MANFFFLVANNTGFAVATKEVPEGLSATHMEWPLSPALLRCYSQQEDNIAPMQSLGMCKERREGFVRLQEALVFDRALCLPDDQATGWGALQHL